jgi:hypothetical protein
MRPKLLNDEIGLNTYTALKLLVRNSYLSQLTIPPSPADSKADIRYLKDFCTVKMCTSRQSGHTTAICRLAVEYFNRALFLSPTERITENIMGRICKQLEKENYHITHLKHSVIESSEGHIYLFASLNNFKKFIGDEVEAIFIDGTFDLTESKKDELYHLLEPCMQTQPQKFFIMVQ